MTAFLKETRHTPKKPMSKLLNNIPYDNEVWVHTSYWLTPNTTNTLRSYLVNTYTSRSDPLKPITYNNETELKPTKYQ